MLDVHYQEQLRTLLDNLVCEVELPDEWRDTFFHDQGMTSTSYDERRRFARRKFRSRAILDMAQSLPHLARETERVVVYTVDVSRGGFAFLHTQQMFPKERCRLWLPTQCFNLEVCRCRRYNPRCYLIGACPASNS